MIETAYSLELLHILYCGYFVKSVLRKAEVSNGKCSKLHGGWILWEGLEAADILKDIYT